jgi:hypothetical protein
LGSLFTGATAANRGKTKGPEFKRLAAKIRNRHNFRLKPLLLMADLYVYFQKEPISNGSRGPEKTPMGRAISHFLAASNLATLRKV